MKKGIEFVSVYSFREQHHGLFGHLSFLLYSLDFI